MVIVEAGYLQVWRLARRVLLLPVEDDGDFALVVHNLPGGYLLLKAQRRQGFANDLWNRGDH